MRRIVPVLVTSLLMAVPMSAGALSTNAGGGGRTLHLVGVDGDGAVVVDRSSIHRAGQPAAARFTAYLVSPELQELEQARLAYTALALEAVCGGSDDARYQAMSHHDEDGRPVGEERFDMPVELRGEDFPLIARMVTLVCAGSDTVWSSAPALDAPLEQAADRFRSAGVWPAAQR